MKQFTNLLLILGAVITSASVQAASALPTGTFTGVQTNATDTITDIMSYAIPIALAVTVGFAVLGWTKKGTKKALS